MQWPSLDQSEWVLEITKYILVSFNAAVLILVFRLKSKYTHYNIVWCASLRYVILWSYQLEVLLQEAD